MYLVKVFSIMSIAVVRGRCIAKPRVAAAQRQRHEQRAPRCAREQARAAAGPVAQTAHTLL